MSRSAFTVFAMWAFLIGCSLDRYEGGGGFETPDLTARIVDTAGQPVFGARVWLVRSNGDSAPASVLDSTLTNSVGEAFFQIGNSTPRQGLGLDAKYGTLLGIGNDRFAHSDTASILLLPSGRLLAGPDSSGQLFQLFVPGSHFASTPRTDAPGSTLLLPYGSWSLVTAQANGARSVFSVEIGNTPILLPLSITPSTLDLSKDSVFLDGQSMYVRAIQSPANWIKSGGQDETWGYRPEFVSAESGNIAFATTSVSFTGIPLDSIPVGFAGQVGSDRFPAVGTIGLRFKFSSDPGVDSGMERWIHLVDSNYTGMRLQLGIPFQGDSSCTPLWRRDYGSDIEIPYISNIARTLDSLAPVRNQTWWISWNADSICVRSESGIFRTIRTNGRFGRPVILLGMGSKSNGTSRVVIDKFRFYRP